MSITTVPTHFMQDRLFSCKKINTHLLTVLRQKLQTLQVASAQTAVRSHSKPEVGVIVMLHLIYDKGQQMCLQDAKA